MSFTEQQIRALSRSVPARAIRTRMNAGKELTYIEGWFAIAEANRIFGFDGWDRETIEPKCLVAREARGTYSAIYSARVRITVRSTGSVIVRDGHGTGEAYGPSAGEVHDRALKAAETDATKRALATFGKAFGLALYAGAGRRSVRRDAEAAVDGAVNGAEAGRPEPNVQQAPLTVRSAESVDRPSQPIEPNGRSHPAVASSSRGLALRRRIEKSVLALPEPRRVRNKEHLRFVASQPCLLCSATPSDPHHVRFAQPRAMGRKVGDEFTVPLCRAHHRELHHSGDEPAWWHNMGIEPLEIAQQLWTEGGAAVGRD